MAKATIKLEFDPGDNIQDAFKQAIRIATILDVWCQFNFNGVTCITGADGEIDKGVEAYHKVRKEVRGVSLAFA